MKKHLKWIIPLALVLIIVGWGISIYNGLVTKDEVVVEKWANVESSYQRRMDLIPNLVATVKGYADHEKEVLLGVTRARSKVGSLNINADKLDAATIQKFQKAQDELSGALSKLLVVVERYPDLKANQNFLNLQAQLEGTENRINVARNRFNTSVKEYNTAIRKFPNSLVASIGGFEKRSPFVSQEGADIAPKVEF